MTKTCTFDEALAFLCENDDASEDELEEVIQNTENTSVDMKKVLLTLCYEMGLQRRSTGRRYNSLSGVGAETNRILNYGVRQKHCCKCTYYKHKKMDVPEHECATNFQGSSRAMGADLATELIADIDKGDDTHVENIVMDDDATTICRINNVLGRKVNKFSDIKHSTNAFKSKLWKINHKEMNKDVIAHFEKKNLCN